MKYALLLYHNADDVVDISADDMARWQAEFTAYGQLLIDAGALVATEALEPAFEAATVSVRDGEPAVVEGPAIEGSEHVGGLFIVDVPDRAAAMSWATKCPAAAFGRVEVRRCAQG